MPTLPSEPHQVRAVAESFGVDAARYDRTRPAYPDALVRRIIAAAPGSRVLDIGCGTGTAARQFRAAGCAVLGVEPDRRMAEFARRDALDVEEATFEAWEPAGRRFDAVIAGTSWHWVDPVIGAAKAATVLRPDGRFAAFWHLWELPEGLAEAVTAVYRQGLPEAPVPGPGGQTPQQYQALLAKAADGIRAAGAFGEPEQWRFEWQRRYTRDEWLDQLPTHGSLTRLPADRLAPLLAGVGAAIDEAGGAFTASYSTVVVTAQRAR
jgi:SAM-dependent methyltransferase